MSYLGRSVSTLALAVFIALMLGQFTPAAAGQVGTIKDAWLVMKVHSEFVNEDVLSGSNIDVDVKDGVVTLQASTGQTRQDDLLKESRSIRKVAVPLRQSGVPCFSCTPKRIPIGNLRSSAKGR